MIIIWGTRLFGKVDHVPGLFHVATQFGHLWYLPLVPTESHLVLSKEADSFRGVRIPFSWKSLGVAWLRAALFVLAFALLISTIGALTDRHGGVLTALSFAGLELVVVGAIYWTYRQHGMGRASYERAMELAQHAKMNEHGMIALGLAYGKIDAAEADRLRTLLSQRPAAPATAAPPTSPAARRSPG